MNKSKRIAISLAAGVLAATLCMVYGSSIRSQAEQAQAETLANTAATALRCASRRAISMRARPSTRLMS